MGIGAIVLIILLKSVVYYTRCLLLLRRRRHLIPFLFYSGIRFGWLANL